MRLLIRSITFLKYYLDTLTHSLVDLDYTIIELSESRFKYVFEQKHYAITIWTILEGYVIRCNYSIM